MPLNRIELPPKSQQLFQIIKDIFAFDFFDMFFGRIDNHFVETEPWNQEFADLGYESKNLLNNLGSLSLLLALLIFKGILIVILNVIPIHIVNRKKNLNSWFTK